MPLSFSLRLFGLELLGLDASTDAEDVDEQPMDGGLRA
jgi:hypothetical protein